jgi:hypothetical protein
LAEVGTLEKQFAAVLGRGNLEMQWKVTYCHRQVDVVVVSDPNYSVDETPERIADLRHDGTNAHQGSNLGPSP